MERNSKNPPRAPTLADLEAELGAERLAALSPQRREKLLFDLRALWTWPIYLRSAGSVRGEVRSLRVEFCKTLSAESGRRIRAETLRRWGARYRAGGAAALIDGRGRHKGGRPLDAVLVLELGRLLAEGTPLSAAHRQLSERARHEGRAWCGLKTLRRRVGEGTIPFEQKRRPARDPNAFLNRGVSKN